MRPGSRLQRTTCSIQELLTYSFTSTARVVGGPILELGAGTGRVLIALAEAGHEIVGVEVSAAMLEAASAKIAKRPAAAARIRLVDADMKDFALQQRFSLVMIPARAFQFVLTTADQRLALNCIRRHLVPAGHVVVDLFDPNIEGLLTADFRNRFTREVRDPRSGHRFRRTAVARNVDWVLQRLDETLRIEELDGDGNVVDSEESSWSLRWTMRQEMAYLFELCGFEPVEQYSDFRGSAPAYGQEQLWVARAIR
jgi:ubiquinone/menaquinone biosynthesis C-methylase UbiE